MIRIIAAISALAIAAPALGQDHDAADHDHMHHDDTADLGLHDDVQRALDDGASLVTVDVLGMVCDFCATALTKTFGRRDEVAAVHVDLDAKTLSIALADGAEMDDATIGTLVERAGYRIDVITRGAGDADAADAS